jgi:Tfp pilus assembly protein PilN
MAIKVHINLASEPFRRDRSVLVALVAVGVVLVVLLGLQISTIVSKRRQSADIHRTIDRLSGQLQTISAEQSKLNNTLRQPENAEVLEHSLFLNALIQRKAISWTRIFADLEKVLPYNVRLVSVRLPAVDSENAVLLDMQVGSKEVPPVIELIKKLEASPQFGATSVQSSTPPSQTDPFYRFHVTVSYAQKL